MPRRAGAGRPVSDTGKSLKAEIMAAFGELGGAEWLAQQARANPAAFIGLLRALVPRQVETENRYPEGIVVKWKGET